MESEKYYYVSESTLRGLLKSEAKIDILNRDGVDNWGGYMMSARDYFEEAGLDYDSSDFEDLVNLEIQRFDEVEEDEDNGTY